VLALDRHSGDQAFPSVIGTVGHSARSQQLVRTCKAIAFLQGQRPVSADEISAAVNLWDLDSKAPVEDSAPPVAPVPAFKRRRVIKPVYDLVRTDIEVKLHTPS